jgi:TusE/DsrC/DsvC family sulfur relay protein
MGRFIYNGKAYELDDGGFLSDYNSWDEDFAEGAAPEYKILDGLTKDHWAVIYYIRGYINEKGRCPLVYKTCKANKLNYKGLKELFPTGYLRGACRLAGVSYKEEYLGISMMAEPKDAANKVIFDKKYLTDVYGFLVDAAEWDENFAIHKAYEIKMPGGGLDERHWQIINYLRRHFDKYKTVPTIYDTCEANEIDLDELEELFPDGYQRGAIKIAGLRVM